MDEVKIAVIGLGYAGLPLARLLATRYPVIGFDIKEKRISELQTGFDTTLEVPPNLLKSVLTDELANHGKGLKVTCCQDEIRDCNFYIVTVPTPVDKNNHPDLSYLLKASETVGKLIKIGDIVVYESTVYPGATEEDCIPVIERISGLKLNQDFFAGYSPERINPGDKERTIEKIKKITSGSTPEVASLIDSVYRSVIVAGTYLAPSIKVAEAAKVIENSQRDINIAFVNELKKIFDKMNIDTNEVLAAAATKWNFLNFKPGLVGGHCISIDPYYLAQKAMACNYHPEIILAGRRINDGMGEYVASQVVKLMIGEGIAVKDSRVLVLGITFKENCPDIRNTRVIDLIRSLQEYKVNVTVYDPLADSEEVKEAYGLIIRKEMPSEKFDVAVLAVGHDKFKPIVPNGMLVYDLKGFWK